MYVPMAGRVNPPRLCELIHIFIERRLTLQRRRNCSKIVVVNDLGLRPPMSAKSKEWIDLHMLKLTRCHFLHTENIITYKEHTYLQSK